MTVRDWGVFRIHEGDCREVLRGLPDCSVDSIVTDPPYELGFMGKGWDKTGIANDPAVWAEALRVLKPGGHLLAFSGTRTYHRMACAIEDAGFEVRDQIGWAFGSGMPKSRNGAWGGTALKPAWEPIAVARKALVGTVEENWRAYGTGALNIDPCRIACNDVLHAPQSDPHKRGQGAGEYCVSTRDTEAMHEAQRASIERTMTLGRWPANLIHDGGDEVLEAFPEAPGQLADASSSSRKSQNVYGAMSRGNGGAPARGDAGSAARFFYCAKAAKKDRGEGNDHPTVKPTDLMRYLCRLVTPPGGTVLDVFAGSGSTGKAAMLEGFRFVGIEQSSEYVALAERRIATAVFGPTAFGVAA